MRKILHLVTQRNQPYGSVRKCCERCGLAISAMKNGDGFVDEEVNFTESFATKREYICCTDKTG